MSDEHWARLEEEERERRQRKLRNQPRILLVVVNTLVLATGLTATLDLRRLATPGGTALAWTQAAVFGDCEDYLRYSVADRTVPDSRTEDQLCRDLRASTQQARADSVSIGLTLGRVLEQPYGAEVEVTITRAKVPTRVAMKLVRSDGHWRVVRNALTCSSVGCA